MNGRRDGRHRPAFQAVIGAGDVMKGRTVYTKSEGSKTLERSNQDR
jgi:hypothetical protein